MQTLHLNLFQVHLRIITSSCEQQLPSTLNTYSETILNVMEVGEPKMRKENTDSY